MLSTVLRTLVLALVLASLSVPASAQRRIESVSLGGYEGGMTIEVAAVSGRAADARTLVRAIARWVGIAYRPVADASEAIRVSLVTGADGSLVAFTVAPPPPDPITFGGLTAVVFEAVGELHLPAGRERTTEIVLGRRLADAASLADMDDAAVAARFPALDPSAHPAWMVARVAILSDPRVDPHAESRAAILRAFRHGVDALRACYQDVLDRGPRVVGTGALELDLVVTDAGIIGGAEVTAEPTGVASFAGCIVSRVRAMELPTSVATHRLHVAWTLRQRVQR